MFCELCGKFIKSGFGEPGLMCDKCREEFERHIEDLKRQREEPGKNKAINPNDFNGIAASPESKGMTYYFDSDGVKQIVGGIGFCMGEYGPECNGCPSRVECAEMLIHEKASKVYE